MKPARAGARAVSAAFLAIAAAVPLVFSGAAIAEYTLPKFVALNLGLALAAWGAAASPAALAAGRTVFDLPLAALLAAAALSAALCADPRISFEGRYDSYVHGVWGMALVAAAAEFAARAARGREEDVLRLLARVAAAVGAYALVQRLGWDPLLSLEKLPTGARAVSTLGSPVDLGAYLALLVPLALRRAEREASAEPVLGAALVLAGLVSCGSRGAMAASAFGTAAYFLLTRREPRRALPLAAAGAAVLAGAVIAWAFRHGASVSDQGRREVWRSAWNMFAARPWLGWGPDGFAEAFKFSRTDAFVAVMGGNHYQAYAHNDVLHVLSSLGLIGAAAYAWLAAALLGAASEALASPDSRGPGAALTAGLLALWVNLQLNPAALEVWTTAALCAGLLVSLGARRPASSFPRPALAVAGALATALFLRAAVSMSTDVAYKRAVKAHMAARFAEARAGIAKARAARPCELTYLMGEFNAITDWINADRTVEGRLALLEKADAEAREALACHPNLAMPHYIAGGSARIHYDLGFRDRLEAAIKEYEAALALDPKFGPLLDARESALRLRAGAAK